MYTREQASLVRQQFWTTFGKYMSPILSADGTKVNWVNYKTGIPQLFFRMDADKNQASISIQVMHKDLELGKNIYTQLKLLQSFLHETLGEEWNWEPAVFNEFGQPLSKISTSLAPINIFKETDWPLIISFLKPRLIALDLFWVNHKMIIEMGI
jgi:hypothetical protein